MRKQNDTKPMQTDHPARQPESCDFPPHQKGPGRIEPKPKKKDDVQEASEESFPASDPPAHTGVTHT